MPRNRMIKPDFWCSEQVVSCSRDARLLFIGLLNFSDDNGVHKISYIRLRLEIFPNDNCCAEDIKRWMNELINCGLVREYVVKDVGYWLVTGFKKHQRIDRPTPSQNPLPESDLKIIADSTSTPRLLADESANDPRGLVAKVNKEKIKERKEKNICEVETSPCALFEDKQSGNNDVQEVFKYWQTALNHPRAKLDVKRKGKITQALNLGYSIEQLKQAIDGCKRTPHNMGENDQHEVYDDIELIMRDASHIERFIRHSINPPFLVPRRMGIQIV